MRTMTRRERRAERQRQYLIRRATPWASPDHGASGQNGARLQTDCETPLPGWLRPLDYKVSGESGALKVPSKVRTWHLNNRANGHAPPPGQAWDRSGPAYVVAAGGTSLAEPIIHHRWQRMIVEQTAACTGE